MESYFWRLRIVSKHKHFVLHKNKVAFLSMENAAFLENHKMWEMEGISECYLQSISLTLQIRTLRPREAKWLFLGYMGYNWQNQDSHNPSLKIPVL